MLLMVLCVAAKRAEDQLSLHTSIRARNLTSSGFNHASLIVFVAHFDKSTELNKFWVQPCFADRDRLSLHTSIRARNLTSFGFNPASLIVTNYRCTLR